MMRCLHKRGRNEMGSFCSWRFVSYIRGMSELLLIKSISRIKEIYQRGINQILTKPRSLLPQAISDHFCTNDVVSAVDCVVLALSVMSFTVWDILGSPTLLVVLKDRLYGSHHYQRGWTIWYGSFRPQHLFLLFIVCLLILEPGFMDTIQTCA